MAEAKWFPDLYYPVPIMYKDVVYNNALFFVIEHNNQHGLLYGKHQNTLPIRFGFYQTNINKINGINIDLGNIICSNASFKLINAQLKVREELETDPHLKIKNIYATNNTFSCSAENTINTAFGDFTSAKYYNISKSSNDNTSMYQYSDKAAATDKIVLTSSNTTTDNKNYSLDNRDVTLQFSCDIQFSVNSFRVPDKTINTEVVLDLPKPKCSIMPSFDTNGAFIFRMFSTTPCYRMTYTREVNGVIDGWHSKISYDIPFCIYGFNASENEVVPGYKLLYDCYDYNTGFKSITQTFSSNYVYTDPHIYGLSTTSPNILQVRVQSDYTEASLNNIYARIFKNQNNIITSKDYQNSTYAKNPIVISELEASGDIKYSVTVVDKHFGFQDPNTYNFDIRNTLPKNNLIYYNAITDVVKSGRRTTSQLCSVDKSVYIANGTKENPTITNERGYSQQWEYKINNLSYGKYEYIKPQNPWNLNSSSSITIKNKRIAEYPVDFYNAVEAETFKVFNRQPRLYITNIDCIGTLIKCKAITYYNTDTEEISINCSNWQYALIKCDDYKELKCIRQAVYNNGNISSYYSLYTNIDLNWVDIENSDNKSEIEFTAEANESNTKYYLLVRARTTDTNLPTNNLVQFNDDLTPKYVVQTTGGVPVYYNDKWQLGIPYIYHNNKWVLVIAKVYLNNNWIDIDWDGTTIPWDNPIQEDNNLIITQSHSAIKENNNLRIE